MKTKTRKRQSNCRFVALTVFSSVPLSALLTATPAWAQMGLSDDMANEAATAARNKQEQSPEYTFKSGDFRMLLSPALSLQWNSNVNLTQTDQQSSLIILPTLGVAMSYPLTDRNLLQLNVNVGYSEYVQHSSLSSWYVQTGSGFSFNFYIKDVLINLHDQISYVQNSSQNPQIAGTGSYGTFDNSVGVLADWSLKYFDLSLGFDHQNTIATSSQFNQSDNATESGYGKAGYKLNPKLTTGVEGSVAYTAYSQDILNDNTSYSAGVFGDWHPDSFLHIEPRVGYTYSQFQQTSQSLQTSNLGSWYADLNMSHDITHSFSYSINAGRNTNLGVQSDLNQYWFLNGNVTWNFIRNFSLQPNFFFQHGQQGIGSTLLPTSPPNSNLLSAPETYNWYGGGISFNYTITKRFVASLSYGITARTSSTANRGYTQNVVGIQITYRPI